MCRNTIPKPFNDDDRPEYDSGPACCQAAYPDQFSGICLRYLECQSRTNGLTDPPTSAIDSPPASLVTPATNAPTNNPTTAPTDDPRAAPAARDSTSNVSATQTDADLIFDEVQAIQNKLGVMEDKMNLMEVMLAQLIAQNNELLEAVAARKNELV